MYVANVTSCDEIQTGIEVEVSVSAECHWHAHCTMYWVLLHLPRAALHESAVGQSTTPTPSLAADGHLYLRPGLATLPQTLANGDMDPGKKSTQNAFCHAMTASSPHTQLVPDHSSSSQEKYPIRSPPHDSVFDILQIAWLFSSVQLLTIQLAQS